MTPAEKRTLEMFAARTGTPYVDVLRQYRGLPKLKRWKAIAEMRRVEARFQEYIARKQAGWFKRTAATLKAAVLGGLVRR